MSFEMSLLVKPAGSRAQDRPAPVLERGPRSGVLVRYEPSAHGRAALLHAIAIAREASVPLTVISVAQKDPVVGCGHCRANTVFWNQERRSFAEEDLAEAARLACAASMVDYSIAEGRPGQAIGKAAERAGADLIVLPWQRRGRLRRLVSRDLAEQVRRMGRWEVVVAPAAPHGRQVDGLAS